jgi:RNA polymerase sigma-70 factor (ECF subfamily)
VPEPQPVEHVTAVYREHYRQVYAYAVARAGRQQADEVVADTFLVAWRRLSALPRSAVTD